MFKTYHQTIKRHLTVKGPNGSLSSLPLHRCRCILLYILAIPFLAIKSKEKHLFEKENFIKSPVNVGCPTKSPLSVVFTSSWLMNRRGWTKQMNTTSSCSDFPKLHGGEPSTLQLCL
jgi:hypothetical protein